MNKELKKLLKQMQKDWLMMKGIEIMIRLNLIKLNKEEQKWHTKK